MEKERVKKLVGEVRRNVPLVHNITNYVTVNDCANALLAVGGSPIMSDDILETADITGISNALVINIGTLNQRTIESMLISGKKANEIGIPVIFDPVGAGASKLRNETVKKILDQVNISIIRGNLSEMSYVAGVKSSTKGVDSSLEDSGNDTVQISKYIANTYSCIAAITGETDVISNGRECTFIHNGNKMLSLVTGTGCMTSSIIGAYAGAANMIAEQNSQPDYYTAAIAGIATMGIAGELAFEQAGKLGTGSFRVKIIDSISLMNNIIIEERANFDEQ